MHMMYKKSDELPGTSSCQVNNTSRVERSNNNWRHNQQAYFQQIDVPADKNCLFLAVSLAYLIPVQDDDFLFQERYKILFGRCTILRNLICDYMDYVQNLLQNYNPFLDETINNNRIIRTIIDSFRNQVVTYIERKKSTFKLFIVSDFDEYLKKMRDCSICGGEPEIRAMSEMLKANITVFGTIENTEYNNGDIQIKLFHVNCSGIDEGRNHYNYGLEQSVVDHMVINNIENNKLPLGRKSVEAIAKIKWYENKVMFKVTSLSEITDSQLLHHYQTELEKSANEEKLLAVMIDLNNFNWVTLVIHYKDSQFHGYYVDCQGRKLQYSIKNAWNQTNNDKVRDIIDCTIKRKKGIKKYESGMFAFKDAESIIKEQLNNKVIDVQKMKMKFTYETYYLVGRLKRDRKNFAEKLKEKVKMEVKIRVCSKILQQLEKIRKFSYENVNIFLYFLETITLEDSSQFGKDYSDKFKEEIFGSENSSLVKTIRNLLFMHSDYNRAIEGNTLHQEMMKLLKKDISCKNFFQKLKDYMCQVSSNLETNDNKQLNVLEDFLKTQREIEEMHKNKTFGYVINDDQICKKLRKLFKNCIKKTGNKLNAGQEDEIMFILTANIIPNLIPIYPELQDTLSTKSQSKLSCKVLNKIRKFRSEFLHNFHTYGEDPLGKNFILKEGIRELLDYFFKYSLSEKAYKKFKNPSSLEQELKYLLRNTQQDFKKNFKLNSDVEPAALKLVGSKPELSCVVKYLKLMSVIDNESVTKERERKRKISKNQVICRELKNVDRKRIYIEFEKLEKALNENDLNKLIKDLKTYLETDKGTFRGVTRRS
ncbi:hypothetical protein ABEB36_012950 [Hypothenemus hampei]|uniref:OTU domain-containing protein n=1 Tax=Hypothenemus hampei TaxID=57062 RepID=A0ABD1E6L0_HYPHA